MSAFNTLLDVPEQLLATHDRLRANGFSVVSVVNARSQLDARIWLGHDAKKQKDLEGQGYRVQRFRNQEVIENPVGVWRMIAAQLTSLSNETEHV